ncbi:MAG: 4Fe-4S binding protein [Phycisphaerae bacterium]|nr:4Fe-4S binding protein [Phycisphaerae bacterium]
MKPLVNKAYVTTNKERCRMCYTCVRECPAKAIRIVDGQAEVIPERCIACGNCVKVCSQDAKLPVNTIADVETLLASGQTVVACIAPSFPADFPDCQPGQLVGMLRQLGFDMVSEVAFGADLVADRYYRLFQKNQTRRLIATSCPAIVGYVERYYPDMVEALVPIVSPMVAAARVLHEIHGEDIKVVFIGPCIAKKVEASSSVLPDEIETVITFVELHEMFEARGITPEAVEPSEFDPPHPGAGALFPIGRGMLQAAGIPEDLIAGKVVATEGRGNFLEALREFSNGSLDANLLEVLCCQGCIMGPGMTGEASLFRRRSHVSRYVRDRMAYFDQPQWDTQMRRFDSLDLSRAFTHNDQRIPVPGGDELQEIMARMGKFTPEDELNCGACGYDTCRDHAIAIYKGLAESEMCLPNTIEKLRSTIDELAESNGQLATAQEALMQSEKLASMGQLAAGIAHEVNNPLGIVLMYAHLLLDECDNECKSREDLQMIADQADRCKKIVAGLLHFARQNKLLCQRTDILELVERAGHSVIMPENIACEIRNTLDSPIADVDGDQMLQVLTNLISNAYAAMPDGGKLTIEIGGTDECLCIKVTDTGTGIPTENRKKIFEPFFTTKQIGKGTGLGLAVTYGIIKMHRGSINVESNADGEKGPTGTTFKIELPREGACKKNG